VAISVSKTFAAGEILTASDLNGIETNILNNAQDLTTPRTKAFDLDGFQLTMDNDGDTGIVADSDDRIDMNLQGFDAFRFDGSTASSVMGLDFTSVITGAHPTIEPQGTDTNSSVKIAGKGTGGVEIATIVDSNGLEVVDFAGVASAVNQLLVTNAAAGDEVAISADGETNVSITIKGKGTGTVKLGDAEMEFPDSDGSANQALVTDGAGAMSFSTTIVTLAQLRGFIGGYVLSNDTDTDHDINIAAGSCLNSAADTMMQRAEITKQIDSNWSAGDDAGGFPSGLSLSTDTWYHVFIIEDGSGTVDAGFDTDVAASNLLSDSSYTNYRRIGSVLTDGTSNIIGFTQRGDEFLWSDPPEDHDASTSTTAANVALSVPTGVTVRAMMNVSLADGSSSNVVNIYSPDVTAEAPSLTTEPYGSLRSSTSYSVVTQVEVITNTTSQVAIDSDQATGTLKIATRGWRDFLGRWD